MTNGKKARTILQRVSSILLLSLMCSCEATLFHSYHSVDEGWQRCDTLVYTYTGQSVAPGKCGINVEARMTAGYRYKNLVVRAEYSNARDSLIAVDTIPLAIYSDNGRHLGNRAGMLFQRKSETGVLDFPVGDSLVIRLFHLMPDDTLKGVFDVGLRLIGVN